MFCIHCGKELDDGSKFCIHCGERLDEELAEAAADTAEEVKETVSEIVEEVKETAAQNADVAETVADTVEEVKETVSENVEEAGETAAQTVDVVKAAAAETAEEVKETVSEKAEESKETVAQTVDVVKAVAADTVEEVKETVSEKAEEVKETAAQTVDLVKASAAEKTEEVKENVAETAETAPETVAVEAAAAAKAIDVSALLKNKKVLIIAAAAVIVLILLIIIIAAAASAGSSSTGAVALKGTYYTYTDAGETLVFYNGKQIKGTDLSSSARIARYTADGSKAVVVDGKDALYYLSGDKITKITEDFDSSYINMSADGSAVCYTFDDTLFIYKGGKATKIADVENMSMPAAISPNGDTVAYAEIEGTKISTYAWKGGKLTDLDAKIIPFAVSNGGGIIYGIDRNSKLNYIKKLKKDSAESVKSISNFVAASYDCTQIMFKSDNGVYYFDSSLKEAIKVSGDSVNIIFPEGSAGTLNDLKSFIAYSDSKVYSFKRKGQDFEKNSLVSYSSDCKLSADGKTLVYLQGDSLYKTTVSNTEKKTLIGEEVDSFEADKSLKNIYFRNDDDALRYADGKSKSGKKIVDDVNDFIVTPNGVCVFVDDDDELQYSVSGGDRKKANLEDIENLVNANGVVYVVSDGEFYISTDGKKFNKS